MVFVYLKLLSLRIDEISCFSQPAIEFLRYAAEKAAPQKRLLNASMLLSALLERWPAEGFISPAARERLLNELANVAQGPICPREKYGKLPFTPSGAAALQCALLWKDREGKPLVEYNHVLLGILESDETLLARWQTYAGPIPQLEEVVQLREKVRAGDSSAAASLKLRCLSSRDLELAILGGNRMLYVLTILASAILQGLQFARLFIKFPFFLLLLLPAAVGVIVSLSIRQLLFQGAASASGLWIWAAIGAAAGYVLIPWLGGLTASWFVASRLLLRPSLTRS
jgi:hypothetical protein